MLSVLGIVYAVGQGTINVSQPSTMKVTDVGTLISGAIATAFILAGLIVFAYLVWGGLQWVTAGGDKAHIETARGRITNALVGLAIIASAYAIVRLLEFFFGYSILGPQTLPTFY